MTYHVPQRVADCIPSFADRVQKFVAEMQAWADREKIVAEEAKKPLGPRPMWENYKEHKDPKKDFSVDVANWEDELLKRHHPFPHPIENPNVERAVRLDGDKYVADYQIDKISDDVLLREKKNVLLNAIHEAENAALEAVQLPLGKRRLANMQEDEFMAIDENHRKPEHERHLYEQASRRDAMHKIRLAGAQAMSDVEDLTLNNIDKFKIPTFG